MPSLKPILLSCLIVTAGCSSPAPQPAAQPREEPFRAISKGMTRDEVLERIGLPEPRRRRPDIWDYELGGPNDPVYRVVFEADRVVVVKRFDGYAVVDPAGNVLRAPHR